MSLTKGVSDLLMGRILFPYLRTSPKKKEPATVMMKKMCFDFAFKK
jgi:hypothetical protein